MNLSVISVIMAVYNAAAYMRRGIDSVLGQDFRDIEVLLVDDGSTDDTGAICDEYAAKDCRVRVFHEAHGGVGHSRQVGVDNARGVYSIHIDADDYIEQGMLKAMHDVAMECDAEMVIADYYIEEQGEETRRAVQQPSGLTAMDVANDMVAGRLWGALWNKLVLTDCYRRGNVRFRQDLNVREDIIALLDLLEHINRIVYLPQAHYHYVMNPQSLTHKYLDESREHYAQEVKWHEDFLASTLLSEENKQVLQLSLLNIAYTTLLPRLFSRNEWMGAFARRKGMFGKLSLGHKQPIVMLAYRHYQLAKFVREIASAIRA